MILRTLKPTNAKNKKFCEKLLTVLLRFVKNELMNAKKKLKNMRT